MFKLSLSKPFENDWNYSSPLDIRKVMTICGAGGKDFATGFRSARILSFPGFYSSVTEEPHSACQYYYNKMALFKIEVCGNTLISKFY